MKKVSLPKSISHPIDPTELYKLYLVDNKSVAEISKHFKCSQNKINYWLERFEIPKRNISEAMSAWHKIKEKIIEKLC